MAITNGNKYNFLFGTVAQYNAAKAADKIVADNLYFLTDSKQIYVGEDLYTGSVSFVNSFPGSPDQGVIYCNPTTHETKVWNGSAWQTIVPAVETTIDGSSEAADSNLATIGAIKAFVSGEIGSSYTINKADVAEDGYLATYQLYKGAVAVGEKINIPRDFLVKSATMGICETANVPLSGLAVGDPYLDFVINTKDASRVKATGTYVAGVTYYDAAVGGNVVDTTGFEEGVTDVSAYWVAEPDAHIYINVADLVDTYTVADTASVDMTMDANNQITADVRISDNTGNILSTVSTSGHEGLFAEHYIGSIDDTATIDLDVTNKQLTAAVKVSATANNALSAESDGLYVATVDPYVKSIDDTATVDLAVDANGKLTAGVAVSAVAGNILEAKSDGLYVAPTWSQISAS